MNISSEILSVWSRFDDFPMETLTKAWYYHQVPPGRTRQRSLELMKEHRQRYGTSGNCFDLAFWLRDEFQKNGVSCWAVGTDHDHAALMARDGQGYKYFCDLGDQWLLPLLADTAHPDYREDLELEGLFPGAKIKPRISGNILDIQYLRPGGHISRQAFNLTPLEEADLMARAEATQNNLHDALCECRIWQGGKRVHWEYSEKKSFISNDESRIYEPGLNSLEEWAQWISQRSGIKYEITLKALEIYEPLKGEK